MKLKLVFSVLVASALTLFGGRPTPEPITVIDVAYAQGYALSPNGDFEYYIDLPNPRQTGTYDLRNSADQGAHWYFVQARHFYGGEFPTRVWFLPNPPGYPDLDYQWVRIGK